MLGTRTPRLSNSYLQRRLQQRIAIGRQLGKHEPNVSSGPIATRRCPRVRLPARERRVPVQRRQELVERLPEQRYHHVGRSARARR